MISTPFVDQILFIWRRRWNYKQSLQLSILLNYFSCLTIIGFRINWLTMARNLQIRLSFRWICKNWWRFYHIYPVNKTWKLGWILDLDRMFRWIYLFNCLTFRHLYRPSIIAAVCVQIELHQVLVLLFLGLHELNLLYYQSLIIPWNLVWFIRFFKETVF